MSIVRAPRPTGNFTIIGNNIFRPYNLSFLAQGVLCNILSQPSDKHISVASLEALFPEGREALATAMKELEGAGHLTRKRGQTAEGDWKTINTFYEVPVEASMRTREPVKPRAKMTAIKTVATPPAALVAPVAPAAPARKPADEFLKLATSMVDTHWVPATRGNTSQAPFAVRGIVASALRNGVPEVEALKALLAIAEDQQMVTTWRFDEALNGKPIKGQIAADKKVDWSKVSENLWDNDDEPF